MSMINHLIFAARQPECLLALLPCNNGCVISPMRSDGVHPVYNTSASGSWAQRHGLITPANIAFTPQYISADDPEKKSHIATQLNFSSNTSSKTFIVKAHCPRCNDGSLHINAFITQGNHSGSANHQVFQFALWENTADTRLRGYVSTSEGVFAGTNVVMDASVHENFHVFAMTVDNDYSPDRAYIRLYLDGVQVASSSRTKFTWNSLAPGTISPDKVAIRMDTDTKYAARTQIAWALIFDRALSQNEIPLFK